MAGIDIIKITADSKPRNLIEPSYYCCAGNEVIVKVLDARPNQMITLR
jgi:hypothetical protein